MFFNNITSCAKKNRQSGSVFFAVFAAVAVVGLVGVATMQFMRGPLLSATNINRRNMAETQMQMSAKVAALTSATSQPTNGDCDADSFVEPVPYKDAGALPHPAGGGYIPDSMGTAKMDPWNSLYGYCVWDHGPQINAAGCGGVAQKRLAGTNAPQWETLSIISAGPDKTFQTSCNAWADADADLKPDIPLVNKPNTSDDLVLSWTYAEAGAASAGLWQLKMLDPTKAVISKDLEVAGGAQFSKPLTFTGMNSSIVLPGDPGNDSITGACSAANDQQLRRNTSTSPPTIQLCSQVASVWTWSPIGGAGGGGGGFVERANFARRISVGNSAACAIKRDNSLWCWGNNTSGQLGDGTTTQRTTPVQTGAATSWMQVVQGNSHSCALQASGLLWCWGLNTNGQLGDASTTQRTAPVQITTSLWSQITAGSSFSCGIKNGGTLFCWGLNTNGQLGIGSTTQQTAPTQIGTGTNWIQVGAGTSHACGVKNDGTLWCWGLNTNGQVGDGTTTQRTAPVQIGTETTWVQAAAGGSHSCALKSDGTLWCWGLNTSGQVGDGTTTQRTAPVQVGTATTWSQVAIANSANYTCAMKGNGTLSCFGANASGQLGDGSTTARSSPVSALGGQLWTYAAIGGSTSCGLTTSGMAWCWGLNGNGQVGDASTTTRNTPVIVSNFVAMQGDLIVANETQTTVCDTAHTGAFRYNTGATGPQFCNGTGWQSFLSSQSSAPPVGASGTGYFVMSKGQWSGYLYGLSGANDKCVTDLTTNTGWAGYSTANAAGRLTSAKVRAFLCTTQSCSNLLPLTTYVFADANDASHGGATFTTDQYGAGPQDTALWSSANRFGGGYRYWVSHGQGNSSGTNSCADPSYWYTLFANGDCNGNPSSETCGDYMQSYSNGSAGNSTYSNSRRWGYNSTDCGTSLNLICIVDP